MSLAQQIQIRCSTKPDRYPAVFKGAAKLTADQQGRRVLSFGCSTGEECVALADRYFTRPDDLIVGVDVVDVVVQRARRRNARDRVRYFHSADDEFLAEPNFHAIFAMSVLCVHDTLHTPAEEIPRLFPFSRFEEACGALDLRLREGGLLVIFNASYRFADTVHASRYTAVPMGTAKRELVPRHRPDGTRYEEPEPFSFFVKKPT